MSCQYRSCNLGGAAIFSLFLKNVSGLKELIEMVFWHMLVGQKKNKKKPKQISTSYFFRPI